VSKTITLRLPEETYQLFQRWARMDNRPISNLIETAALRHLQEHTLVEPEEMEAIVKNPSLVRRLKKGSKAARERKGRLIG